jgi:putative FmdB family regulatory protein
MPLYEYEPDAGGCDYCRGRFEVMQKIADPPLKKCPKCGQKCHRVFSSFATIKGSKSMLSPKNLAEKGFTQYQRAGDGYYEKTGGGGPDVIRR